MHRGLDAPQGIAAHGNLVRGEDQSEVLLLSLVGPLCQGLPCRRMLIPAEPEEIVGADFAGQSKPFRARPPPLARYALSFVIVVADGKVFLEIFLRIPETVLSLCRDHEETLPTRTGRCVYHIHFFHEVER